MQITLDVGAKRPLHEVRPSFTNRRSGAAIVAGRLRELFEEMRIPHEGHDLTITASFGVSGYPEVMAETPMQLIAAADEALYEAKHTGRNCVVSKPGTESQSDEP